jgi:hypothetical protein
VGTNVKNVHDVIIGTGIMYINGSDVGQLKNEVRMKHVKEFYTEEAGFPSTDSLTTLVKESGELTADLLEVNLDTIASLMVEYTPFIEGAGSSAITQELVGAITSARKTGAAHSKWTDAAVTVRLATTLASAVDAAGTVLYVTDASIFTAGDTITLKNGASTENATIDADGVDTGANTLTLTAGLSAGFAAGSSVINTAVSLVEGTDYYLDRIDGAIWRVSTSTKIADDDQVVVSYTYTTFTSSGFTAGGISPSTYYTVRFEHTRRDGKIRVVELYRCQVAGDFELAFAEKQSAPLPIAIKAFSDSTRTVGDQLFRVYDRAAA